MTREEEKELKTAIDEMNASYKQMEKKYQDICTELEMNRQDILRLTFTPGGYKATRSLEAEYQKCMEYKEQLGKKLANLEKNIGELKVLADIDGLYVLDDESDTSCENEVNTKLDQKERNKKLAKIAGVVTGMATLTVLVVKAIKKYK